MLLFLNICIFQIELANVIYAGAESHWPLTVIDLDRHIVCATSPYPKHRYMKLHKQKNDIIQILKGTGLGCKDDVAPKM